MLHEAEESKYASEHLRTESFGSQDSFEDDENVSLRLSNESNPRDSNDDTTDGDDDSMVFQFVDHYAENLVDKNQDDQPQQLELRTVSHKKFEEEKETSDGQISSTSTEESMKKAKSPKSDDFQYRLARVSRKKPN